MAVKLSVGLDVLTAWGEWSPTELKPYVGWVCETFGPDRVMLASNWPVVTLRAPYAQAWTDLETSVRGIVSGADLDRALSGTATEWYGLDRAQRDLPLVRPTTLMPPTNHMPPTTPMPPTIPTPPTKEQT